MEFHDRLRKSYELTPPSLFARNSSPSMEFTSNPTSPDPLMMMDNPYQSTEYKAIQSPPPGFAVHSRETSYGGSEYAFRLRRSDPVKRWGKGISWYMPISMIVIFICGVVGAIAHNAFYTSLHGKQAVNQLMMVRYGTALAFFTKACLVGSVVLAFRQRLWYTLRRKSMSVRGIDSLFAIVEDPTWFILSKELYMKAKLATLMAAATWLIPLASVLSPGSLTADLKNVTLPISNCTVPNLNFTLENTADWRHPRHGLNGYDLPFYNTTPPPPAAGIDWYDQPSKVASKLTTLTVLSQDSIGIKDSPCSGYNCTYAIGFWGPWYNCSEQPWVDSSSDARVNFSTSDMAPDGSDIFWGEAGDLGIQYAQPQPGYNSSVLTDQGWFHGEPSLWFAYVELTNNSIVRSDNRWNVSLDQHLIQCVHQKAWYDVTLWFVNSQQIAQVKVSNGTTLLSDYPDGIRPGDDGYKEFASYHALGTLVSGWVEGKITRANQSAVSITFSNISQTKLYNQSASFVVPNFRTMVQNFYEEIVISLLSEPNMEIATEVSVQCLKHHYVNIYQYHKAGLWVGYAICVTVAFISVLVGLCAIRQNGVSSDTTFSKILATTRNPAIDDEVSKVTGACLGADPTPKELEKLQLKFGIVGEAGWTAFGRPEDVGGRFMLRPRKNAYGAQLK
ncbi:hypothetical protein RUND412_005224 [Rhizina undulata]